MPSRTVIAGLGNLLLQDDGVGVHAAQLLQRDAPAGVPVLDIGTAVLHGLDLLADAGRVIVLDAVCGGQPPGTLYQFAPETAPPAGTSSVHALGLLEAMRSLWPPSTPLPALTILGVEPAQMDYGTELSAPVRAALPRLVAAAQDLVRNSS